MGHRCWGLLAAVLVGWPPSLLGESLLERAPLRERGRGNVASHELTVKRRGSNLVPHLITLREKRLSLCETPPCPAGERGVFEVVGRRRGNCGSRVFEAYEVEGQGAPPGRILTLSDNRGYRCGGTRWPWEVTLHGLGATRRFVGAPRAGTLRGEPDQVRFRIRWRESD